MNHGNETSAAEWERQREQLSALLDGELSEGERVALERHLQGCAACQRSLAEMRQGRAFLRALPRPALPRTEPPTATPSPMPTEGASPARNSFAAEPPSVPVVPLTGAGLLVGGAGLALAGRSARRRMERRG